MLQTIRDRTHGWIAGAIISLVILSFAVWGIHSYVSGMGNSTVIAKVNGVEISKMQLAGAYERARRQMQASMQSGNVSEPAEANLKLKTLETLISIQVLKQGSIAQNYRVSSRQIDGFLESMPEFQENGHFSLPRLEQFLASTMLSAGEFLELIKSNLLIEQPRLGIIFSAFALPDEIENTIALVNQERDIDYLVLPNSFFLKQLPGATADEIQAYYDAHQNEFKTPEQVSIEYVALSLKELMAGIHPSADQLKAFYNDNVNTYTQPMQWNLATMVFPLTPSATEKDVADAKQAAEAARAELIAGKALSPKVSAFVNDASNRKWSAVGQLAPELQKPVLALTKAGEVSEPIVTEHGIVLVKVFAIKEPQVQAFDAVKDKVAEALTRQMAEEKLTELREKLSNVSYEYPDSLAPTAKALDLTVKTTELFTLNKGANDLSANKKIRDAAFSPDVLNSQNNSDVIQADPDTSVVLRIKTHLPTALLPVKTVEKQIVEQLMAQKADAKAAEAANEMRLALESGRTPAGLSDFTWNKVGMIGRYAKKVDPAILYAAFRMPKPAQSSVTYAVAKVPNGYALVALKAVQDGVIAKNQDQFDVFAVQVQNSEGLLEYKLYEQSLMKKAKIVSYLEKSPS